jgi:NADH:ubiquinone oxidoreductase subunit F (NADH-binding)
MTEYLTGQPSPAGAWSLPGAGSRQAAGLPGLALAGRLPGRLPRELLAPGTLLLAGVEPGRPVNVVEHLRRWGAAPSPAIDELIARVAAKEVVGAGGAAFPTDRKLASLVGSRVSHVIINGAEGETASGKDGVLLGHVPHLVIDGAVTAARALGAPRIILRISADRPDLATSLAIALAARQDSLPIELSVGPATFVAGEATAVIRAITGGPALPADLGRPPSIRNGVARRRSHVLLSNAETFARMALAARGVSGGSALASASGAVRDPGVVELPDTATLADLAAAAGGLVGAPEVLITGGWHGRWVPWDGLTAGTGLTRDALAELGGRWGAGAFVWIPEDLPAWDALAGVARELAEGTAGQCGPCWRGLPAVAGAISGAGGGASRRAEIEGLMAQVDGRGICAHPSAAVAALRSALDLIGEDR